ncbi:MAG: rRNA pseudouridine synthase [Firmicutes bacterium]|nr:rRNA pseudouridine synthase [Bacillota bacterium]
MRLHKFLAQQGVASRRQAEQLIQQGRVTVNGVVITELGTRVGPNDLVEVDGRIIEPSTERIYLALHKPSGVITSVRDTHNRPTVIDCLPPKWQGHRLFPVGRLDYDTEGLLLLTNDGDFAYKLTHPRFKIPKTYLALVQGKVSAAAIRRLRTGVMLEDGPTLPAKVRLIEANQQTSLLELVLVEGRKRQVKRMCSAVGHPVLKLIRTRFGSISLTGLERGEVRPLTAAEVAELLGQAAQGGVDCGQSEGNSRGHHR